MSDARGLSDAGEAGARTGGEGRGDAADGVTVCVRVPAALRQVVAGRATVTTSVPATGSAGPSGSAGPGGSVDVRALLDHLAGTLPDLERRVRDEQGTLRRHVNVFVGTTNIRDLDGQDTVLTDGDEVAILPAVSGGA